MAQKNNSTKFLLISYFVIGMLELVSIVGDSSFLQHFTKPFLMPILGVFYLVSIKQNDFKFSWPIVSALFFSWLGDAFLMYQDKNANYFILGLGLFLMAHIFYIICYLKMSTNNPVDKDKRPRLARYDFFLVLIWLTLISVLFPVLGDMKILVVIYSITVTGMVLAALHRFQKTHTKSFWMVITGALIFMLSDSMIAINRFLVPIPFANVMIIVTYIMAQYLIVSGLIKHQLWS